jgi:hypothetical protein
MWVIWPNDNAKVGHLLTRQNTARQHTFNRLDKNALWVLAFKDLLLGARLDAARVAGVPVEVLFTLITSHLDFFSVNDDHVVAHIHVWCERRLVLATQAHGDDARKTAQNNAFSVDDDPFLVDIAWGGGKGFHVYSSKIRVHGQLRPLGWGAFKGFRVTVNAQNFKRNVTNQRIKNKVLKYPK